MNLDLNRESVALSQPSSPLMVEPTADVGAVLRLLREECRGCVLVCREGVMIGMFSEREAVKLMAAGGPWDAPVQQYMVSAPAVLSPDDSIAVAIRKLSFSSQRRLPIVDKVGHPLGVVKLSRIVHYLVENVSKAVYTLPPTPHVLIHDREGA